MRSRATTIDVIRAPSAATEHLVPHHEAAVELARAAACRELQRERGPRIRLKTRLDPAYQESIRNRGRRTAEIMQERLQDPDQRDRLREQLRPRGPTSVVCTECGTPFMSRLQGASSRKVILCGEACRRQRKRGTLSRARLSKADREGIGRRQLRECIGTGSPWNHQEVNDDLPALRSAIAELHTAAEAYRLARS